MDFKQKYLLAKANNLVERFRSDEIAKEIAKVIPNNDQQALQTNMLNDLLNGLPFSHQDEWDFYQSVRANAKTLIDVKIAAIEAEVTSKNSTI